MKELTNEVVPTLKNMTAEKQRRVLTLFKSKFSEATVQHEGPAFLTSPCHTWILPEEEFQCVPQLRVPMQDQQRVAPSAEQRVGTTLEITTLQDLRRMSNTPPIMTAPNPTTKRALKSTKRGHHSTNHTNTSVTPGPNHYRGHAGTTISSSGQDCPTHPGHKAPKEDPQGPFVPIAGRLRNHNIISQQAINFLTDEVWNNSPQLFTPTNLHPKKDAAAANLEHLAMPMVHPTTGDTISSYKKLMNNPATMETWQTAFGKDFGGIAQGDIKTGQKGTNAIFVMTHAEILRIPADRTITYARVVVDFRPQKADPHCIRITAGGNLINYPGELTTRTADLITSKLMWNSVLSTEGAKYMCLDINNFYLTAPLDWYKYMKMPLSLD